MKFERGQKQLTCQHPGQVPSGQWYRLLYQVAPLRADTNGGYRGLAVRTTQGKLRLRDMQRTPECTWHVLEEEWPRAWFSEWSLGTKS